MHLTHRITHLFMCLLNTLKFEILNTLEIERSLECSGSNFDSFTLLRRIYLVSVFRPFYVFAS